MGDTKDKLEERVFRLESVQTKTAEHLASMRSDLAHIKQEIDNGMRTTLGNIWGKLNEICPQVRENTYWVGQWKRAIFWIAVVGIGGGLLALAFSLLQKITWI